MSDLQQQIHDIRKPLNTISMQAELVKMLTEAGGNSLKIEAAATKIIQNSKQCSELLQLLFEDMTAKTASENFNTANKHSNL